MRRKTCEIKDQAEIQRILSTANIGRMATIGADDYPYITPVNFVFFDGNIYFHCASEGEKLDNIARSPSVCFEVDIPLAYFDLSQFYHCVIIRGKARIVERDSLKAEVLNALVRKHEMKRGVEFENKDWEGCEACVVEITPISLTAKSNLGQTKGEENRRAIAEHLFKRNSPGDRETAEAMGFHFD